MPRSPPRASTTSTGGSAKRMVRGASDRLGASGALAAAGAVALAALASHVAQGPDQARLQLAAALAFGHGVALVALSPGTRGRRVGRAALWPMLAPRVLCSGRLADAASAGGPTALAPFGGMAMLGRSVRLAGYRGRGRCVPRCARAFHS